MLELAINRKAKKFIFLSSGAVYGNVPLGTTKISESVFGELDPRSLRAAYEEGKRAGETLCYLYSNKFGISAPAARIAHTYGPGIKPDDDRSFAEFLSAAIENRPLVLNSEGSDIRYFCYLSDTLSALFTILLLSKDNLAYNIGSSTEFLSILDLANLIVSLFPERGLTIERSNKNRNSEQVTTTSRQRVVPLDTNRLKNLGWTEKVKLVDGLRRTILAGSLYGAT
jgi:nucleoside-diphosphate-sugar epimerase